MSSIAQKYPDHKKIHMLIADGYILDKPTLVSTVLGSCVSVTFHCPEKKIGAIFHAILPVMPEKEKEMWVKNNYRYVDSSIRHILWALNRRGVKPEQIEAKVFGGAQVNSGGGNSPGMTNIRVAVEILAELNIKILASDVGGRRGRNLIFVSDTGEVFVKTHKSNAITSQLEQQEPVL